MVGRHTALLGKVSPTAPEMWARLDHLSRHITKSERIKQAMLKLKLMRLLSDLIQDTSNEPSS